MKAVKVVSFLMAFMMLFSLCAFAAPTTTTEEETKIDNAVILTDELEDVIKGLDIKKENVSVAYYDFKRDLKCVYNPKRLFEPNEMLKFPLAYVYFKDLAAGKYRLNEDVGDDNLRTVYLRSLTKDFTRDGGATDALIQKMGGLETLKRAMYEITYTKVPDEFFDNEKVTAEYLIDFLSKYYNEAFYGSADYKNMLITPIKQFSPNRYSETYVYDCKITHRYGFSKSQKAVSDMGIMNSANPFGFVIEVEGVKDPEDAVAEIAEFLYNFNLDYGGLLLSQVTTMPDVPDKEKMNYDGTVIVKKPLMILVISSTVLIATGVTIAYIVIENKKKNQDRLD